MIAKLIKRLKQAVCLHHCYLEWAERITPDRVECACHKCGALLVAPYGLAMPCKWERAPTASRARELEKA